MNKDWQELTKLSGGEPLIIEKIRLISKDITIEGSFELPPLAKLTMEDQVFIAAFVRCHGSIKEMEGLFGVSYPSIKNRLNRIGEKLDFVNINLSSPNTEILSRLERGEISAKEALELLRESKKN
ncbi:MAG: DUF2089 domain-containing protein [candidate division Zixibacteria bacterium]|nr:DUF2089 domain-containing protein [candidate division Zixibacteria bacterium]